MLKEIIPFLFICAHTIVFPFALFPQNNFNISNITCPRYEKYVLKGKDADQKEIRMVIEYTVQTDEPAKANSWLVRTTQTFPDSKTEANIVIRQSDLQPISYSTVRTYKEGSYTATFDYNNRSVKNDDPKLFFCANPETLIYILRTFPFSGEIKEISIRTFGSRDGGFNFTIKNNGLKRIKLKSFGDTDVYELELGINIPFFSAFIPKTYYYFKNDNQKTFVKFKGTFMPGTQENEIELSEYSTKN